MLDQPAGRPRLRRPPRADHIEIDVGAVAGKDVAEDVPRVLASGREVIQGITLSSSDQSIAPVISSPSTNTWLICRSPFVEHWCPWPECSLGNPAVARNQVGGEDAVGADHSHSPSSSDATTSRLRPAMAAGARRAASVPRHLQRAARGRGRRLAEVTVPSLGGRRVRAQAAPPQDLRGRDRRHSHRLDLDVGARLISVDLQEHVADPQGRALVMGHDHLDD